MIGMSIILLYVWFVLLLVIVQILWFLILKYRIMLNFIITAAITIICIYITRTQVFAIQLFSRIITVNMLAALKHFTSAVFQNVATVTACFDVLITILLSLWFLNRFRWFNFHLNGNSFRERLVWDTWSFMDFIQRILLNNL